jgi:hypothetical protein
MKQSGPGQKRRSPRSNLLMAASLEHRGSTIQVMLRNLSPEGALVESEDCPAPGSLVVFRKNDLVVSGRIAWTDGRRAGIAFDGRLDPEAVLREVPLPRPLRDEVHKRPGFHGRLTAEEGRFAEFLYGRPLPRVEP